MLIGIKDAVMSVAVQKYPVAGGIGTELFGYGRLDLSVSRDIVGIGIEAVYGNGKDDYDDEQYGDDKSHVLSQYLRTSSYSLLIAVGSVFAVCFCFALTVDILSFLCYIDRTIFRLKVSL